MYNDVSTYKVWMKWTAISWAIGIPVLGLLGYYLGYPESAREWGSDHVMLQSGRVIAKSSVTSAAIHSGLVFAGIWTGLCTVALAVLFVLWFASQPDRAR